MVAQRVAQHQQRQQQQQAAQNVDMADETDVVVGQPSPAAIRAAVQQQQQQDSSAAAVAAALTGQPTAAGDSAVSVVINQNNSLVLSDPKMMTEKLVSELQNRSISDRTLEECWSTLQRVSWNVFRSVRYFL
ncbi:Hypothetical protein CINCED_3A015344 [Cinara cedri]|uniref:Uncharacterized protein n=1 Tax=Cinara cedri TaxID=506608 RepID=A0A5E4NQJ8_9HEMI|nr:Hypothetical protein CINCED_3A015344 [Cinara cedri]